MNFSAVHSFSWFLSGKRRLNKKRKKPKTVYKSGAKNAHAFFLKQWFFVGRTFLKERKYIFSAASLRLILLFGCMFVEVWKLISKNFYSRLMDFWDFFPNFLLYLSRICCIFFLRISNLLIASQLFLHAVVISAFFNGGGGGLSIVVCLEELLAVTDMNYLHIKTYVVSLLEDKEIKPTNRILKQWACV